MDRLGKFKKGIFSDFVLIKNLGSFMCERVAEKS